MSKTQTNQASVEEQKAREHALRCLALHAVHHLPETVKERIELYRSLAQIMPTPGEAREAERIAWMYEEAETQQSKFLRLIES